jgi:hypothetical protein
MDKVVLSTIIVIIFAGFLFWALQSGVFSGTTATPLPVGPLLFYSPDCSHCKIVEDYIIQNKIDEKVKYARLEVPFGTRTSPQLESNAKLAIQLAQGCKLDVTNGISIPLLYDGKGKCLLGQDEVINFFKNEAGIK